MRFSEFSYYWSCCESSLDFFTPASFHYIFTSNTKLDRFIGITFITGLITYHNIYTLDR